MRLLTHHVLAVLALAVLTALQTRLVALAVLLQAVRLLAVAPLHVLIVLYLLSEGVWVSVHQGQDCIVTLLAIDLKVVAADTVAAVTGLVESETIAVEFQALGLFAVAKDLLVGVGLFRKIV